MNTKQLEELKYEILSLRDKESDLVNELEEVRAELEELEKEMEKQNVHADK